MISARKNIDDEFYTLPEDVDKELSHYMDCFHGKKVLCNCNDALHRAFPDWFENHFDELGLASLTCTSYGKDAFVETFDGKSWSREPLIWDGDFRTPEMIDLLAECDVVATNPPFSLFRALFNLLIEYGKEFILIGNLSAVQYFDVFPHIKSRKVRVSTYGNDRLMFGNGKGANTRFFTTFNVESPEPLELTAEYSPEKYSEYINVRAIEVSKIKDIPKDYYGAMGVPNTFIDKWNPEQFELLESQPTFRFNDELYKPKEGLASNEFYIKHYSDSFVNQDAKSVFSRLLIKRVKREQD